MPCAGGGPCGTMSYMTGRQCNRRRRETVRLGLEATNTLADGLRQLTGYPQPAAWVRLVGAVVTGVAAWDACED